jgi:hypothetical protein
MNTCAGCGGRFPGPGGEIDSLVKAYRGEVSGMDARAPRIGREASELTQAVATAMRGGLAGHQAGETILLRR